MLDVAGQRATPAEKPALVVALQAEAVTSSIAWKPNFETLLDTELASDKTRIFPDAATLLADLVAVDAGGSWSVAEETPPRSRTEGRALRQAVKFHRTHTRNPSQPNPIATGFHTYPPEKLLRPPPGIQIVREHDQYHYMREQSDTNPADFEIATTGNPAEPGYIYTDQGEFSGNYDAFDKTGLWSEQGRSETLREYMDLGTQHKYPHHTVGHVMPFEHSPKVHDTATTAGGSTTYQNTDQFRHNVVIENPVVGEQIKRAQVEAPMIADESYFFQFPVYSATSPMVDTTYNSAPITPGQVDTSGNPVLSKRRRRPDELQFGRPDGGGGTEWAAFDNTGVTRYDTQESKVKKTGTFEKRAAPLPTAGKKPKNRKRVRAGLNTRLVWDTAKAANSVTPPLATVITMPDDTATYDPRIETLKTEVSGYDSPPPTPFYMGTPVSAVTRQVAGFVMRGQHVTATDGVQGVVIALTDYDDSTDESTVELEPDLQAFT